MRLGEGGLTYNIQEQVPHFFAPAPLANTLMAGDVTLSNGDTRRVDAIDLNLLGQALLQAVEDVLAPEVAVPLVQLGGAAAQQVDQVLEAKATLAEAISAQVAPLLQVTPPATARQAAAAAFKRELQVNLVKAYAIETIVQYDVAVDSAAVTLDTPVRLAGQPTLVSARDATTQQAIELSALDFTLSPAKVSLSGGSHLTFFFDTQKPSRYEDIELNLAFRTSELEYNIVAVPGVPGYESSDWLSLVEPLGLQVTAVVLGQLSHLSAAVRAVLAQLQSEGREWSVESAFLADLAETAAAQQVQITADQQAAILAAVQQANPNHIGHVQVPIPLRTYPIPPSLVLQQAQADPDSVENLADVRQWQYVYTYEHLDVAQDSLESDVRYNLTGLPQTAQSAVAEDSSAETLFDVLVRFNQEYGPLKAVFDSLAVPGEPPEAEVLQGAIAAFATLITSAANAWTQWDPVQRHQTISGVDYLINEEEPKTGDVDKEVVIATPNSAALPLVKLPGYREAAPPEPFTDEAGRAAQRYRFTAKSPAEAALDPVYGESSIPDRTLVIQDRDILAQQNAWSGVWLSRNRALVPYAPTNPAFVFQTPQVRFSNWVTPLLVNRRPWDIAALSGAGEQSVRHHLTQLFDTALPQVAPQTYGLRIDCRYSFAVTATVEEPLFSAVPVLLTPRIAIAQGHKLDDALIAALATEIERWRNANVPVENQGRYQLTLNLFSGVDAEATLPLLKIENLFIDEVKIAWPEPTALPVV